VQAGNRKRTLNMEAVTGIYDVTFEIDAIDIYVGPNGGMVLYDIYCWTFLVNRWKRTLLENCALPRHYAASRGNFLQTFRDILTVPSSGVKNRKREPLKMGPIGHSETSVRNHHYSLCNSLEERSSQLIRGGSLKSRIERL
jgi:hypothetical protein